MGNTQIDQNLSAALYLLGFNFLSGDLFRGGIAEIKGDMIIKLGERLRRALRPWFERTLVPAAVPARSARASLAGCGQGGRGSRGGGRSLTIASGKPDRVPGGFASNGYGNLSPGKDGLGSCFLIEVIATFFLYVIIGTTSKARPSALPAYPSGSV